MRIKGLPIVRSGLLLGSPGLYTPRREDGPAADPAATEDGDLGRVNVQFSPFNTPYEINSWWEGRFIEQTKPGAFRKTISEAKRSDGTFSTKMLFNHGSDLTIGDKPLAVPDRFAEINTSDYHGPELEGRLINTDYNRDQIKPLLEARALGSSFMFEVINETWRNEPEPSATNPEGLPERDILEVRAFEAGPVTWPASPTASAGLRSRCGTDGWMERLQNRDARRYEDLVRSFEAFRAMYKTPDCRPGTPALDVNPAPSRQVEEAANRAAIIRARRLELMKAGY
jgi:phage head maturation protease